MLLSDLRYSTSTPYAMPWQNAAGLGSRRRTCLSRPGSVCTAARPGHPRVNRTRCTDVSHFRCHGRRRRRCAEENNDGGGGEQLNLRLHARLIIWVSGAYSCALPFPPDHGRLAP